MQNVYPVVMMVPEAHDFTTCRSEVYRLSPSDTVALRESLRGYNRLGALNIVVMTFLILILLVLWPSGSAVVAPLVVSMLLLEYIYTALSILAPRFFMGRVIEAKKDEEMESLQVRLNELLPLVGELTEEEHEKMTQIQEAHDTIRDSPENLLPLGEFAKVVGALALSTLAIVATAFADAYVAEWVEPFLP
jgi:hypothetical protein